MNMKKKMNLLAGLTLVSALLASCSSSDVAEETNSGETGKKVEVTFSAGISGNTRVTLTDNGEGLGVTNVWAEGDQIGVYDATNGKTCTCTLAKMGTDKHYAYFRGEIDAISANDQLYAYYPASSLNGTTATFDLSASQAGTLDNTTGLGKTAPRYSAATAYKTDGSTMFDFTNATAIVRVNIKTPTQKTIKSLTISGDGLINKKVLVNTTETPTTGNIVVTLNGTTGTQTDPSGNLTVYVSMFGQTLTNGFKMVAATADGLNYDYYSNTSTPKFTAGNATSVNRGEVNWVAVGDFVYTDGTFGSYEGAYAGKTPAAIIFNTQQSAKDKANSAFGHHGYAMALKSSQIQQWKSSDGTGLDVNDSYTTESYAAYHTEWDGYTHCQKAKTISGYASTYPAINAALTYATTVSGSNSGWYLPSIGQLYLIAVNLGGRAAGVISWPGATLEMNTIINNKISVVGDGNYTPFSGSSSSYNSLWSSSESGANRVCTFDTNANASLSASNKHQLSGGQWQFYVRPVIAF